MGYSIRNISLNHRHVRLGSQNSAPTYSYDCTLSVIWIYIYTNPYKCTRAHTHTHTHTHTLAGPAFTIIYVVAGLPLARFADAKSRSLVLLIGLFFWSAAVLLTGFVKTFWQLLLLRILLGIGDVWEGVGLGGGGVGEVWEGAG